MRDLSGNYKKFIREAKRAAEAVKTAESVLVISHIDADGISAGSIASMTLERLGIEHVTVYVEKITEEVVSTVNSSKEDFVWICDLGSGYFSEFTKQGLLITDHHVPDTRRENGQMTLSRFSEVFHVNPHCFGIDGSVEISGAGATYMVAKEVDPRNIDLAFLGLVGAVGDFQDSEGSGLTGLNRVIVDDAFAAGDVLPEMDLRLFGRETRGLVQYLQYSNDPELPGLTNSPQNCVKFYSDLNIGLTHRGKNRVWNDLSPGEKERATEKLTDLLDGSDVIDRLYGEVYTLPNFEKGSGLRDAKEFATILNSCGRYEDADTGMRICCGDITALEDAERNRAEHRKNISSALTYVRENHLMRERRFVQYFDAGDSIRDTVVGIVAGMLLNTDIARRDLPIIAFADAEDGVKVSARADRSLVNRGLNLSEVMKKAAGFVGGFGGGHSVAAGATIPADKKEVFLDAVEDLVSCQII
ncbi:MAG: DHHA1 domain-containing protein [Candidatus Methanomethylophilaceae archaeon]|jgi:single-stranded-DNA-specific exonuclease